MDAFAGLWLLLSLVLIVVPLYFVVKAFVTGRL